MSTAFPAMYVKATPEPTEQIFRGLQRVRLSHLADRSLFDSEGLSPPAAE